MSYIPASDRNTATKKDREKDERSAGISVLKLKARTIETGDQAITK